MEQILSIENLFTSQNLLALVTLTAMEIVLGIDNIVFLSIVSARLPEAQRPMGRRIGLALALLMRIGLLLAIKWVLGLKTVLFEVPFDQWFGLGDSAHVKMTGKGLVLLVGGLFLIWKSTKEIHHRLEDADGHNPEAAGRAAASFAGAVAQIVVMDLIFSLDSVITAVGMAKDLRIMIAAVVIAVTVMLIFASRVSDFVEKHPTVKMLALAFLLLIGVMLVADGIGGEIPKGYIYFAMAFSLGVETLNLWAKARANRAAGRT
jgi:predicted tellurium resistance membrane protein TerC